MKHFNNTEWYFKAPQNKVKSKLIFQDVGDPLFTLNGSWANHLKSASTNALLFRDNDKAQDIMTFDTDADKVTGGSDYIFRGFDILAVVNNGTIIPVSLTGLTGLTATFRLTDNISFIGINSVGGIEQQNTAFTNEQRKDIIVLGTLVHTGSVITSTTDDSHLIDNYLANDLATAVGSMNLQGNNFNPASTDLTLRKEAGISFAENINRSVNTKDPNVGISGVDNPAIFLYVYDNGSGGVTVVTSQTEVDPDFYDDGSGTLVALANNTWSNPLCYHFPAANVNIVRYGNKQFANQALAEAEVGVIPPLIGTGFEPSLVRTTITIQKGETDLTNAIFKSTGKFGLDGGGGGQTGGTFQDFQDIYGNSVSPQITTTNTGGSVDTQRGSDLDTDNIKTGRNAAGTITSAVTGEGK